MSERMNKERAKEVLNQIKNEKIEYLTIEDIQEPESEDIPRIQKQIQALDIAIEGLETRYQMNDKGEITPIDNEWVDVRDKLPSEDEEVLTTDKLYNISIARYCNKKFFDNYGKENHYVIAWKKVEPYERKE